MGVEWSIAIMGVVTLALFVYIIAILQKDVDMGCDIDEIVGELNKE